MNYNKEAKCLTFRRGSEVSQVYREGTRMMRFRLSGFCYNRREKGTPIIKGLLGNLVILYSMSYEVP